MGVVVIVSPSVSNGWIDLLWWISSIEAALLGILRA